MNIGYFIAKSPHYLPTILPLICETGGTILTFQRHTERYLDQPSNTFKILYFRNYKHLIKDFPNLNINILVHPSFSIQYFKKVKGLKHVQIFHGTSDKPFNYHKSLKQYDLIAVPGPRMREEILQRGLSVPLKIAVIGYPKIDNFLNSRFDSESFKDKLGIDRTKRTVLYSPTWDDPDNYSSFSAYIRPLIKRLRSLNLIIKPHPDILKYRPWQIAKAYLLKNRNCFLYPKSDSILPFMVISDVLITDISSVSHEYLPFDKPMVFFSPKPIDSIPQEHRWIWQCGDVVEDAALIFQVVDENLKNPMKYKEKRNYTLNEIFLTFDGRSSIRFKNEIKKL